MNTLFTKSPVVGTPLTPQVIRQINTAVRRYMPIAGPGVKVSHTSGGSLISAPQQAAKREKAKPLPFEVRFDWTLDSESGGWKIYLPTEHLVQYDGEYLDPLGGVTAILDGSGDETGWYSFDELTLQDSHVWLVISESGSTVSAAFAGEEVEGAIANICIAEISCSTGQGTVRTVEIKQSAVGAIILSPDGEGVEPDGISTALVETPSGQTPDASEGKLEIKGFKDNAPLGAHSLSDYLQGQEAVPQGGITLLCRNVVNGNRQMLYLPLDALFSNSSISGDKDLLFVGDIRWNLTTHTLQKRVDSVDLRTGAVSQGNWSDITNGATTGISTIIGS